MRTGEKTHKGDKREAILQAALELIAEHDLQHTPMSLISKRSGASAGIIYHYFESKDDLLLSLYYRVKQEMNSAIGAADDPQQPLAKRFQSVWISLFHYCLARPQAMFFLEQYESIPTPNCQETGQQGKANTSATLPEKRPDRASFQGEGSSDSAAFYGLVEDLYRQDLLKDLPSEVLIEFTLGVALRLARQVAAGQLHLDEGMLKESARACWDAITR